MSKQSAFNILKKHIKDFEIVDETEFVFKSDFVHQHFNLKISLDDVNKKTIHSKELERILIKIRKHNCFPSQYALNKIDDNCYKLSTFTLKEVKERFEYLYHQTDVEPSVILKDGLKIRYSLNYYKGFPPLIFLSRNGNWSVGYKYTYKIRIRQRVYFDTNLNHKCMEGNNYFCVLQNIKPSDITLFK